jgi:fluoride exporter
MIFWFIAIGSAIGGVSRYALSLAIQNRSDALFPTGTLIVNVTGSLVAAFLLRYALESPALTPQMRALLVTGFCGAYTTFSTFSYETVKLVQDGDYRRAALNTVLNVALALVAAFLGFAAAHGALQLRRHF